MRLIVRDVYCRKSGVSSRNSWQSILETKKLLLVLLLLLLLLLSSLSSSLSSLIENLCRILHVFLKVPKFEWNSWLKNLFKLQELAEVHYEVTGNNSVSSTNFSCGRIPALNRWSYKNVHFCVLYTCST